MSDLKPTSQCMEWPGKKDKHGYGVTRTAGFNRAHRLIYSVFVGPIPEGLLVLHSCDNRSCVNPEHLRVGTDKDNAIDRELRKRSSKHARKLTDDQVRMIRGGLPARSAIEQFGIASSTYYCIRSGRRYRDISNNPESP